MLSGWPTDHQSLPCIHALSDAISTDTIQRAKRLGRGDSAPDQTLVWLPAPAPAAADGDDAAGLQDDSRAQGGRAFGVQGLFLGTSGLSFFSVGHGAAVAGAALPRELAVFAKRQGAAAGGSEAVLRRGAEDEEGAYANGGEESTLLWRRLRCGADVGTSSGTTSSAIQIWIAVLRCPRPTCARNR
jgi:hypothetical protein